MLKIVHETAAKANLHERGYSPEAKNLQSSSSNQLSYILFSLVKSDFLQDVIGAMLCTLVISTLFIRFKSICLFLCILAFYYRISFLLHYFDFVYLKILTFFLDFFYFRI